MYKFILLALLVTTTANAAVETSTSTTSSGTTIVSGGGGISRGYNITTQKFEVIPQCFPWVWLTDFLKGNITDLYTNQTKCRVQRLIDFGF